MTEQLKEFYKAYAAWLDACAPQHQQFDRTCGLCHSLEEFSDSNYDLLEEMRDQFSNSDLDWKFPFDDGHYAYCSDANKHLNPDRVAWVRKHAEIH